MDFNAHAHSRHLKDLETAVRKSRDAGPADWSGLGRTLRALALFTVPVIALYLAFGAVA